MSKTKGLYLRIDQIGNAVANFFSQKQTATYELKESDNTIVCKVGKENVKEKATLTMYILRGGAVSHQVQCTPTKMDLKKLAEDCWDSIVNETNISVSSCSCYSFKNISEDDFKSFSSIMKDDLAYTAEDKTSTSSAIKFSTRYSDKYGANVTANYYNNGTLTIQGALTPMLVYTWSNCVDLLGDLDSVDKDALITLSTTTSPVKLNPDLSQHISNLTPIKGTKVEVFIATSIKLANSGMVCDDNGWIPFCILKGLDALLSRKLTHDNPANAFDKYGEHFIKSNATGKHVLKPSNTDFDTNLPLKQAIEDGYELLYRERNTSFHVDRANVETSTVLTYEKAIEVVEDALKAIDKICKNW